LKPKELERMLIKSGFKIEKKRYSHLGLEVVIRAVKK